nr:MAG TPA: hypothetical protein [Caudoviricetes sp.]
MADNNTDDFEVIVSDVDGVSILTENSDKELSVSEMVDKVFEQATHNFLSKNHQYSTIVKDSSYSSNNEITVDDIEEYAQSPQNDLKKIQEINQIIKSFVNKDDIIGRVYECIQMYTNPSYDIIFDNDLIDDADDEEKQELTNLIKDFNKQVNIRKLLNQGVPLSYLNGTYVTYLRNTNDGNYIIDIYPLGVVEISEYTVDDEPLVLFNVDTLKQKLKFTSRKNKKNKEIVFKDAEDVVKNSYPKEVYDAYRNGDKYAVLDQSRVGVVRVNNLDGLYGLSPIFKALKPAIVLSNIESSDNATVKARGKKIIHQKIRKEVAGTDYAKKAFEEMAYAHDNLIDAWKNKTVLVTTPWWVESISYVEPNTDTTNKDTLNTYRNKEFTSLGISFLDTYNATLDVSKISLDGLMKYIDMIICQFADIINKYYKVLFVENNKDTTLCPEIQIKPSQMLSVETRKSIAEFVFTTLGGSFETAYDILGISNAKTEIHRRQIERENGADEVLIPHQNFYNQSGDTTNNTVDNDSNDKGGRPKGEETEKQLYDETRNEIKKKGGGSDA